MLTEVFQPLNSKFVSCPAVINNCDSLVLWDSLFLVLDRQVILASKDKEGWNCLASSVDSVIVQNPTTLNGQKVHQYQRNC
jgi:hypothetical protein